MARSANFIESIIGQIETTGTTFTEETYTALGGTLGTILTSAFTLYVAYWGVLVLTGRSPVTVGEVLWRVTRMGLIYAFCLSWGTFNTLVYSWASEVPDDLGTLLMREISGSTATSFATGPGQALSDMWNASGEAIGAIANKGGLTAPGPWIIAAVVWVAATLFFAICIAMLIFAKLVLWILLAIAPLFIALALFDGTRSYFDGWVRTTFNHFLIPVVLYALMAFFLVLVNDVVDGLYEAIDNDGVSIAIVAPYFLVCVIGTFIIAQVPTITQGITGSVSTSMGGMIGSMMSAGRGNLVRIGRSARTGAKIVDHAANEGRVFDGVVRTRSQLGLDKNIQNRALARAINNASNGGPSKPPTPAKT